MVSMSCLLAALAVNPGLVASQAVYRCDDGRGGVLYSDIRCKDGTNVDLLPGKADPAAIERLQHERRAFDERQAAREARAKQEADALRADRRAHREAPGEGLREYRPSADWYYWSGVWPWPVVPVVKPPLRPRPDKPMPAPSVPARPELGRPSPPPAKLLRPMPSPGRRAPVARG
jgi:hypothetical protein